MKIVNTPNKAVSLPSSANILNADDDGISTPSLLQFSDTSLTLSGNETDEFSEHDERITTTMFRGNSDYSSSTNSSTVVRLSIEKPLEHS